MTWAFLAAVVGLVLLCWSADRFVAGAAAVAHHLSVPPLIIGMVIIGFGTSAPEMVVSAFAAAQGNPGIALGNAYGSNTANIALILGLTAVLSPLAFDQRVFRKELPLLTAVTAVAAWQLWDGVITRMEALILMLLFSLWIGWTIRQGMRCRAAAQSAALSMDPEIHTMTLRRGLLWLLAGLLVLAGSSRLLVWGAVEIAQGFGVSDLVIGLTIVALGTSLPELASSIAAVRKNEHDMALGNVLGSNLFNTLAVVGIAGVIHPIEVGPEVLVRDFSVMAALTLSLFVVGFSFKGQGSINRIEGSVLLAVYLGYMAYLLSTVFGWR